MTIAEKVEKALSATSDVLTDREYEVVSRYYGLNHYTRHTLEEIGKLFGLTRERIRQIKAEALIKIKLK